MSKPLISLINLDLLLDYNSLLFALLRSHFLTANVSLAPHSKLVIEMKSPERAFNDLCSQIGHKPTVPFRNEFMKSFRAYLQSIKPQIFGMAFVHYLRDLGAKVVLTSYLDADMLETVMKCHKNWLDFPVIGFKDATDIEDFVGKQTNYSQIMVIDGNIEVLDPLTKLFPGFIYLLIKNANFKAKNSFDEIKNPLIRPFLGFEDIEFSKIYDGFSGEATLEKYPKEFICDFSKKPISKELECWGNVMPLGKEVIVESYVIRGFGRGGKQLGMPTANLEITSEINELLKPMVPGIYYGWVSFDQSRSDPNESLDFGRKYECVISTGFNPFYENKEKTFEVFVMDKFKNDYYGAFIRVEVKGFIRCESDLKYFAILKDHLIKMIHNDVETAKSLLLNRDGKK